QAGADGILIMRYLFSFSDAQLMQGNVTPPGSTRTTASEIRDYLEALLPDGEQPSGASLSRILMAQSLAGGEDRASQMIAPNPTSTTADPGDSVAMNVEYDVSDGDNSLGVLSLRVHYDSTALTFDGFSNLAVAPFGQDVVPQEDTEDFDSDPATDRFVT